MLTSAQSLALIEEKQKKEEAKQKRKEQCAIKKAKQEEEKKGKAEERAKKAAEQEKRAAEKEELRLQKMDVLKTRKGKRAKISGDISTGIQSHEISSNECAVCFGTHEDDIDESEEPICWAQCTSPECSKWMHEHNC